MKNLAIITARGGSKRIPGKNIKDFCGKPIMAYSIAAALDSGIFDIVMVSTEDREIARLAVSLGAQVPFLRSEAAAGDYATTNDVVHEVIEEYRKLGETFDYIACIYPTAPFITGQRLKEAMELLIERNGDRLLPVVKFSFPPQRALEIKDGRLGFIYPEYTNTRSQDLPPHYHDAGQFCFIRYMHYIDTGKLIAGNIIPMELSEMEVQDIDSPIDWQLAELKYRLLMEQEHE